MNEGSRRTQNKINLHLDFPFKQEIKRIHILFLGWVILRENLRKKDH